MSSNSLSGEQAAEYFFRTRDNGYAQGFACGYDTPGLHQALHAARESGSGIIERSVEDDALLVAVYCDNGIWNLGDRGRLWVTSHMQATERQQLGLEFKAPRSSSFDPHQALYALARQDQDLVPCGYGPTGLKTAASLALHDGDGGLIRLSPDGTKTPIGWFLASGWIYAQDTTEWERDTISSWKKRCIQVGMIPTPRHDRTIRDVLVDALYGLTKGTIQAFRSIEALKRGAN